MKKMFDATQGFHYYQKDGYEYQLTMSPGWYFARRQPINSKTGRGWQATQKTKTFTASDYGTKAAGLALIYWNNLHKA